MNSKIEKSLSAVLPEFLHYHSPSNLKRLGRDYDGGYLVFAENIEKSDLLIGLGINDDWSFEQDFMKLNPVPVFAYDGSVNIKKFERTIKRAVRKLRIRSVLKAFKIYFSYKKFFSEKNRHFEKFVSDHNKNGYITLDEIFHDAREYKNIYLKIDIEGFEYRILDSILRHQDKLTGLVIEFHDCDLHIDKIKYFIEKLNLKIIHIHPNNCADISPTGIPLVLEISFGKYSDDTSINEPSFPHCLDMPNTTKLPDIRLSFGRK